MNPKWEIKFGTTCGGLPCPSPSHCVTPREYDVAGLEMCLLPGLDLDNLPAHVSFETTRFYMLLFWVCLTNVCLGLCLYASCLYVYRLRRRGRRSTGVDVPLVNIRAPPPVYRPPPLPNMAPPPLVVRHAPTPAQPIQNMQPRLVP